MKKLIIMGAVLLGLHSCVEPPTPAQLEAESNQHELNQNSRNYDQYYEVYTLEGCEYIVAGVGKYQWGSHKGNCKNPIHNGEVHTTN
jgi:hypothetical protein